MLRPSSSSAASRAGAASVYLPEEQDEFFGSSISPSPPPSSAAHSDMSYGAPPSRRVSSSAAVPAKRFPSAKEEKAQAFAQAKAAVARVQNGLPPDDDPTPAPATQPPTRTTTIPTSPRAGSSSAAVPAWETAAAEKKRLFEQLQTKAAGSPALDSGTSAAPPPMSFPAQTSNGASSSSAPAGSWETAAEEKARLFKEAQGRVAQSRGSSSSAASPATAAAPKSSTFGLAPVTNGTTTQAPKWESAADEKARLFREAQGRATQGSGSGSPSSPPSPPSVAPAAASGSSSGRTFSIASVPGHETAEQEKARLKRQYEAAQQAVSARQGLPLQTASSSSTSAAVRSSSSSASVPVVIAPLNISKNPTPLRAPSAHPTADEEKARLRFLDAVAARDQAAGASSSSSASVAQESATDAASFVSSTAPGEDEPIPYDALFGGSVTVASPPPASAAPTAKARALTEKVRAPRFLLPRLH